jgi:hypothetical protein
MRTPKAFRIRAQGWALTTLGLGKVVAYSEGVAPRHGGTLTEFILSNYLTQGCQSATLGFAAKRFQRFNYMGSVISTLSVRSPSTSLMTGSRGTRPAANLTQFFWAALASYIAVSAQAISCCGEDAC